MSFNALCAVDISAKEVITFATVADTHPLVTNESLFTKLNLEGVMHCNFEVDTAALHNIISKSSFDHLQTTLKGCKCPESKKLESGVGIRLADGSLADQECTVVQITVSTDLYHVTNNPFDLTFLVVDGPNNLVGRHALASMWPVEFKAFKDVTTANFVEKFPYEEYAVNCITENINCNSSESLNTAQVNKLKSS